MTASIPAIPRFHRARTGALVAAAAGAVAAAAGWILTPVSFYRAYLHGWLLWLGVSLGSMGITMIIHLLGGSWGAPIRRLAEAAAMVLPLLALLFAPIAIGAGLGFLFPWAHGNDWQNDPLLVHRRPYLNLEFFLCRAALFAACWIALAWLLRRGARRQGPSVDQRAGDRLQCLGGLGLVVYVLTMGLFASTDWILSCEPHYKSTVFGLIVIAGQGISALCLLIGCLCLFARQIRPRKLVSDDVWNDLASVLLTAVVFWAYLVICQFVINWMGNTQDENRWYLQRASNGWAIVSCLIVALHLLLPLGMLLFRRIKRSPSVLLLLCAVLLGARALDGFCMINASGTDPAPLLGARLSWLDIVLPLTIGAAWVAGFLWVLGNGPVTDQGPIAPSGAGHAA